MSQPGTPALLRSLNDRTALGLLFEHGTLTRNQLGELSGLSKPTASQMVQRLEAAGLIEPVSEVSGGRGPNAIGYGVKADRALGVAIAVEVDELRSTLVDATGTEYPVVATPSTKDAVADVRAAVAKAAGSERGNVKVVAIGIPGSVDPTSDELLFAETLEGWPTKGVRELLEKDLGLTVLIDNDAKLAAVAERREGSATDIGGFALLWMGDGLGLAVDLDGVVYRGAAGGAGEIGYLPVPRAAAQIDPRAEDLQDLIGSPTVAAIGRAAGVTGSDSEVIDAMNDAVREQLAPRIALGVVPVLAILDPEVVVLGGPTGAAGGQALADLVREHVARTSHWNPRVIATTVSSRPVLRGAREVLMHEVRERLFAELGALP